MRVFVGCYDDSETIRIAVRLLEEYADVLEAEMGDALDSAGLDNRIQDILTVIEHLGGLIADGDESDLPAADPAVNNATDYIWAEVAAAYSDEIANAIAWSDFTKEEIFDWAKKIDKADEFGADARVIIIDELLERAGVDPAEE